MNLEKYIGLPYQENGRTWQGVDCWGLARLYYREELGIELPDYSDLYSGSWDEQVTKLITVHKESWQQVSTPNVGDLCLFNIYGEPAHVGVYIGENKFLHCRDGLDSVVESLSSVQWSKRLDGFFRYSTAKNSISVTGAPHPLRIAHATEWTVAGTTVQNLVDFITEKYQIGKNLSSRIVVIVDGIPVSQTKWSTTVLKEGQQVSYRTVAQGRDTTRLLLTVAVMIAAPQLAGFVEGALFSAYGATLSAGYYTAAYYAAYAATVVAGTALVNAIAPVRLPGAEKDPGQPNQLNLFNGSSNQANRLGAIPVVLGKVRYTGMLGATPYIETLTDTNILNLLIVWGFGPLEIDTNSINVGANKLEDFYYTDLPLSVPRPVTLYGLKDEPQDRINKFNELYPTDVEQLFQQQGELTNNPTDGNPWREVTFTQQSTGIDLAFSFPEGMRSIVTKGNNAGEIAESNASIEIQIAKVNAAFEDTPPRRPGNGNTSLTAYSAKLTAPTGLSFTYGGTDYNYPVIYRWYTICISDDNVVTEIPGAITQGISEEPNAALKGFLTENNLISLLGSNATYTRLPAIPAGYTRLYSVVLATDQGLIAANTINHLQQDNAGGYTGLALTYSNVPENDAYFGNSKILTNISINGGTYIADTAPVAGEVDTETIFVTDTATVPGSSKPGTYKDWSDFLKTNYIWIGTGTTVDTTVTVNFPYTGVYTFECSVDDTATIFAGGRRIMELPQNSWSSTLIQNEYFEKGQYPINIKATDTGGNKGVALKITYTKNGGPNAPLGPKTIVTFGTPQNFYKRKDPFNWVYRIRGLEPAVYKARVRRADAEIVETEQSTSRHYNKVTFSSGTCYNNTSPMQNPPRGRLARTAIKVQSTSKANGQVDGINALVQSIFWDWDRATNEWVYRATNNPASLFVYVLTHPANAYRLANWDASDFGPQVNAKVDLDKIIEWHNFCNPVTPTANNPKLTYNAVLTSTQSVMDTLRDICAAGKASPIFIDGKWSVVIDKPRTHVVQHFTPHNSWGFEATKTLPRLPHAFRVTIQDESNAYQPKELFIYNYGYAATTGGGKQGAEIFEELSLPGVTNEAQARHLAQWHLAQLKFRPEVYTINTDFEYLVCNRGDLVRVTHDVPLWGTASGRVKSVNYTTKTIVLTEPVLLEPAKTYRILIRNNNLTTTAGSGSVYKTLAAVTTADYYDTIVVQEAITQAELEADNLFMLGELNKETQELIVLSVEPTSNLSARITLVDYSPQIYTADLNTELTYSTNITTPTTGVVENTITRAPNIVDIISTRETREQVGAGIYQTTALLTFSNAAGLTKHAEQVQLEIVRGDESFSGNTPAVLHFTRKETGNYTFTGLQTGIMYKVRVRYCNMGGTIFGPWSSQFVFVAGPSGIEPPTPTLVLDLDGTHIVAQVPQTIVLPADFLTFEYRLYKDTGVEDFWDLVPNNTNNIKVIQSTTAARFNLLDVPTPRMSQAGVTYRVACRTVNRNNEYSSQSALGTLVVTTIT